MFKRAGAALDASRARAAWPRSPSGWRRSAPRSARTCSRTSRPTRSCSKPKRIAPACPISCWPPRARPRASAAWPASTSITLSRSSVEPFLQFSARRDLREKAFRAWIARGDSGGKTDNKALIAEMVELRAERARLLGYETFAHYRLDDAMAKTPEAVRALLDRVWAPARRRALADRDAMQAMVQEEGGNFALAPWDWRYYAEKLRKRTSISTRPRSNPTSSSSRSSRRRSTPPTGCSASPSSGARMCRLASRRAGLGGARRRRQPPRPLLRRLFRAPVQAQRRLDDDAARPGEARRRHPPARRAT